MIRRITSYTLILIFFSSQLSELSIYVDFKINQDFIAEILCINKDEPITTCNGKCFLTKQLKAQRESEEKKNPAEKHERTEVLFYNQSYLDYSNNKYKYLEKNSLPSTDIVFKTKKYIDDIFHPPQLG